MIGFQRTDSGVGIHLGFELENDQLDDQEDNWEKKKFFFLYLCDLIYLFLSFPMKKIIIRHHIYVKLVRYFFNELKFPIEFNE